MTRTIVTETPKTIPTMIPTFEEPPEDWSCGVAVVLTELVDVVVVAELVVVITELDESVVVEVLVNIGVSVVVLVVVLVVVVATREFQSQHVNL